MAQTDQIKEIHEVYFSGFLKVRNFVLFMVTLATSDLFKLFILHLSVIDLNLKWIPLVKIPYQDISKCQIYEFY